MINGDTSEIDLTYNIISEGNINIFGAEFVKNNIKNFKIIIDNKEYKITEKY